jgi:hypothetical protein
MFQTPSLLQCCKNFDVDGFMNLTLMWNFTLLVLYIFNYIYLMQTNVHSLVDVFVLINFFCLSGYGKLYVTCTVHF